MGSPTPTDSWYSRFRKHEDRRSFYIAFAASSAFHLSMVTVFSIVIYFPRQDTSYYDFEIVPLSDPVVATSTDTSDPNGATAIESGGDKLALRGGEGRFTLPALELPTLEFAELERLRVRQEGLQSLSRYDDIFKAPPTDSWSRFSRGLSEVSRSLSTLQLSGHDGEGRDPVLHDVTAPPERIVHRPAEGFEVQIVWATQPRDRKLLFAPPMEALWALDGDTLQRPVELVIQVNDLGKVVNVFSPTVDERELVDTIQMTVLRYRFAPQDLGNGDNQTATLQIGRARGRAGL